MKYQIQSSDDEAFDAIGCVCCKCESQRDYLAVFAALCLKYRHVVVYDLESGNILDSYDNR